MKKISFSSLIIIFVLFACNPVQQDPADKKEYSSEEIALESKKANAFFDRVFDARIDRDPMQQSFFGIKKD